MSEVKINGAKIYLKNVRVIFANLEDEGFGKSITIDATDKDVKKGIEQWVKENKIGKTNPGEANFKTYEETVQYSFRLNEKTKFVYLSGVPEGSLGYGAEVSLSANAFEYNNKFGHAISASLSAVVIEKAALSAADDDIAELLADDEDGDTVEVAPGIEGKKIDVAEIPFD
jgi:hypothetical protein